jgi:hypothetical protein
MVLVLESAAIEDGVRDFPVSPEISISLASLSAIWMPKGFGRRDIYFIKLRKRGYD